MKKNLRLVPEVEIGMAILRCSIEQFCNPAFLQIENFAGFTRTSTSQLMITKSKVLIENTIENEDSFKIPKTIVDNISLSDEDENDRQLKRVIHQTPEDDEMIVLDYEEPMNISLKKSCLPSAVDIPETMSNFAGTFSHVNIPETEKSQNNLDPIESQPNSSKNASKLFAFNSKNTRKRKTSVIVDEDKAEVSETSIVEKETDVIVKPAAKKPKNNPAPKIVHPDSDDEIVAPVVPTVSLKRTATTASKGGLFSFNRPAKRSRQMSIELDSSNSIDSVHSVKHTSSGVLRVPSSDSLLPSIPQSKRSFSGSSVDYSGVWLSKSFANCTMKSPKEEDIKKECEEIDGLGTKDTKPQNIIIYFQVKEIKIDLKSVTDRSDTICNESGQKGFKKFIKKKNYKSQSEVLRTKLVSADETFDQNFGF